MCVISDRNST